MRSLGSRPLVSVVVPTHNRARLLYRALESILTQEGRAEEFDLEVLVIDDGSTDDTPDVVQRCPEVRYIRRTENHGTSAARNTGLKQATGEYVAFLDDDDVWLPWKIRRQVRLLEGSPEVAVAYGQEIKRYQDDVSVLVWPDPQNALSGWIARPLLTSCSVNTSSVLIRRAALERAGYFAEDLRCWEDYDMWLRLAVNEQFRFLPGPAVIYQVSSSGRFLSSVLSGESERDLRRVVRAGLERLSEREPVSQQFRNEVEAEIVVRIAGQLVMLKQSEAQRSYLLEALRRSPQLVRMPQLRWRLSHAPLSSDGSPWSELDQIRHFCRQLKAAVKGSGFRDRLAARRLEAEVWRTVAVRLTGPSREARTRARRAAVWSLSQHPGTIGKALLHILIG